MSQNQVNYGIDPSGAQLLDELLSGEQQNRLTMDGGNTRPSYAMEGTVWTDKSVVGKVSLKRFDGVSDHLLMTIDTTTGNVTIPAVADTNLSNLTATGENHFSNPDLSNLSTTGKHYVAIKGYDNTTVYAENNVVLTIDSNDQVKLYKSLVDNNTSALTDTTKWEEVSLGGGGGEIGDIGFAPFGIDETLNLRRYLNGQLIYQSQFVAFTNKLKQAVLDHPSLATTEVNWQAEVTNSVLGQCGKFVIDDNAGTIRLPLVINIQATTNLALIGTIKSQSLPNITGSFNAETYSAAETSGALYLIENLITGQTSANAGGGRKYGLDASRSSSAYQDDAPVQQEAIQYPYYIQVATGVEETLPAIREYKVNNSDFFGKSIYSDVAPNNASWLASNGQYNDKTVYPDYYAWLLEQYSNPTELKAESNLYKYGSLIDTNGVLSGISSSNYSKLPSVFSPASNQWEMVFKVRTPAAFGANGWFVGGGVVTGADYQGITFGIDTSGATKVYLSSDGVTWDIGNTIIGANVLSTDTDYYFKLEFTGSSYVVSTSTDGVSWTVQSTIVSSSSIYVSTEPYCIGGSFYTAANAEYWQGTIDLKESYININGSRWWIGYKPNVIKTGEVSAYPDYDFIINQSDETFRLPLLDGSENIPDYEHKIDNIITGTINSTGHTYTAHKSGLFYQQVNIAGSNAVAVLVNGVTAQNLYEGPAVDGYSTGFITEVRKGDIIKLLVGYGSGTGTVEKCWLAPYKGNGTLYYYVGDTVQDASLINAGAVLNTLGNKVGYEELTPVHAVVETYQNGTSWYRVYDDGWVEQGGQTSSGSWTSVSFLKPFRDTNYTLTVASFDPNTDTALCSAAMTNKSASGVYLGNYYNNTPYGYVDWIACGYGASS